MDWIAWLQTVLAIAALAAATAALSIPIHQAYLDNRARWPYKVVFVGRPVDTATPWRPTTFRFRLRNRTSQTAFFEIRVTGPGIIDRQVPFYVNVWPSMTKEKLYVEIPPKVWRELTLVPFGPQDINRRDNWALSFTEYYHLDRSVSLEWPRDLDRPMDESATDIPRPPMR
jgi:hypothetical protein